MKKLFRYQKLKYLLLTSTVLLIVTTSCEKDEINTGRIKELMATASSETTVAGTGVVKFIDLSLGVANRQWTFPGGSPETSDKSEVDVIFAESGDIEAVLEIEFYDGTKESKDFTIKVFPVLTADFMPSATKIKVAEKITFNDNSVGEPSSYSWEFEGGTPATSTERNPTIQFDSNTASTVKLTITRDADGSSAEVEKIIQVGPPELCLNGNFETGVGAVIGWQTWNGTPFPYFVEAGGANGTDYTSIVNFKGVWGWAQIMSRDFPEYKIKLESGKNYTMSMYVKADAPVRLDTFRGVNHLPDWSAAFPVNGSVEDYEEFYDTSIPATGFPINITTTWTKISIQIGVPADGKSRTNFYPDIIFGGETNSKIYIDEISVKVVE